MLPQPYPDELVGSILIRGSIWTGLTFERLLRHVTGESATSHSMFTTTHAVIAKECALTPLELVQKHTLIPYAVSFLSVQQREQRLQEFSQFNQRQDLGALAQKLVRNSRYLKFCPGCVKDDLHTYGESYWHRLHQLDGYLHCLLHDTALHATQVHIRTRRQLLPHEAGSISRRIEVEVRHGRLVRLSAGVSKALYWEHALPGDLQADYFEQSALCGYQISRRRIAGTVFSGDFRDYFGESLLNQLGCPVDTAQTTPWPARMLRKEPGQFIPLRHVLLRQFFDGKPAPSVDLLARLHAPCPRKLDYASKDEKAVTIMRVVAQAIERQGRVAIVLDLLKAAGIASLIKHKRERLPQVDAFIHAQRLTNRKMRWSR
jgi:hypothetical protein